MSCILHIDTSTNVCSVAVSEDSHVIFQQEERSGQNHAERLGTFVDEALSFTDSHAIPFDAVAVSGGPGSYTGLRIGVSMAKGICYARNLKLISVPTLELLCVPVLLRELVEEGALLCPMIDARRMEVYAGLYDRGLKPVRPVKPRSGLCQLTWACRKSYSSSSARTMPFPARALRYMGQVATRVLPSPVFISEIMPLCRTIPPMS